MVGADIIIELLSNVNVQSFLISVVSGAAWDGLKNIVGRRKSKESLEIQVWETLKNTMQQFYLYKNYEYDEGIVMGVFCKQYSLYDGIAHEENLRSIIEKTIYCKLTDDDYTEWVNLFIKNCSDNQIISRWILVQEQIGNKVFTKRNLVLQRIEAKLKCYSNYIKDEECSLNDAQFKEVFCHLNGLFCESWKDGLLRLISKVPQIAYNKERIADKMAFIRSNEDCCDILAQIEELVFLYNFEKSNQEIKHRIIEFLKRPHFNKALVVTGTTGAGKSFFIKEYVKYTIELLRCDTVEVVPCIINSSKIKNCMQFEQIIFQELREFIGENVSSLGEACKLLDSLSVKLCFIIDDLHSFVDKVSEWRDIVKVIRNFSRYESFKWILTTSEYEYYILEETQEFLQKYCIKKSSVLRRDERESTIFSYVLSLDELNRDWQVIEHILQDKYNIQVAANYIDIKSGITTPLEAIYFGECASGEEMISFPSTYYEYIVKIVSWKSKALAQCSSIEIQETILKIIDYVIEFRSCNIEMNNVVEKEFEPLRHVQLLSQVVTQNSDIFSVSQAFLNVSYQLRVLPYWASKMVGERFQEETFDIHSLLLYPSELREWIIPCYTFLGFQNGLEYEQLFSVLKDGFMLEYALFCAQRASVDFCNALYDFLIDNTDYVSNSKSCYASLHFIYFCPLKIAQKFRLLSCISEQIRKFSLTNLYERVFDSIISTSRKPKKLKKNMLELMKCNTSDINFINGYKTAEVFMRLLRQEGKCIELVIWDIINYIKDHSFLQELIILKKGHNCSFLDFFIRKCFEEYICSTNKQLEYIYQDLSVFFQLEYPIGTYIKRNLTCAAGNVFSSKRKMLSGYTEQYIRLVRLYSKKEMLYEKETAYFLIKNSITEDDTGLNKELYLILLDLIKEEGINRIYKKERNSFKIGNEHS